MNSEIAKYLLAIGESNMAAEVEQMHNRLDAFSDGLDKAVMDCAIKAADELIVQRDEALAVIEKFAEYERLMDEGDDVAAMLAYADTSRLAKQVISSMERCAK